jgi:hypothetical protein
MKIGDVVECTDSNQLTIGVAGVITGFHESGRAFILCNSGHRWMMRIDRLRRLNKKRSKRPEVIDASR